MGVGPLTVLSHEVPTRSLSRGGTGVGPLTVLSHEVPTRSLSRGREGVGPLTVKSHGVPTRRLSRGREGVGPLTVLSHEVPTRRLAVGLKERLEIPAVGGCTTCSRSSQAKPAEGRRCHVGDRAPHHAARHPPRYTPGIPWRCPRGAPHHAAQHPRGIPRHTGGMPVYLEGAAGKQA